MQAIGLAESAESLCIKIGDDAPVQIVGLDLRRNDTQGW